MDCSPGSSVHSISQARILKWVAISFSKWYSWPRDRTRVSCITGKFFTIWATREVSKGVGSKPCLLGFLRGPHGWTCVNAFHSAWWVSSCPWHCTEVCLDHKVRWQVTVLCNVSVASGYENTREIYRHMLIMPRWFLEGSTRDCHKRVPREKIEGRRLGSEGQL